MIEAEGSWRGGCYGGEGDEVFAMIRFLFAGMAKTFAD
jgi:hypothetical protein